MKHIILSILVFLNFCLYGQNSKNIISINPNPYDKLFFFKDSISENPEKTISIYWKKINEDTSWFKPYYLTWESSKPEELKFKQVDSSLNRVKVETKENIYYWIDKKYLILNPIDKIYNTWTTCGIKENLILEDTIVFDKRKVDGVDTICKQNGCSSTSYNFDKNKFIYTTSIGCPESFYASGKYKIYDWRFIECENKIEIYDDLELLFSFRILELTENKLTIIK